MNEQALTITYLIAAILFIRSLGGLSRQETAGRGNLFGMIGMALAIGATLFHERILDFGLGGAASSSRAALAVAVHEPRDHGARAPAVKVHPAALSCSMQLSL